MWTTRSEAVESASRLAADVNAAAEALDNLKRLLQCQSSDPVQAKPQSERAPLRLPQAPAAPISPGDLAHAVQPRRLGILSFLAGFALSAAIGALLYILLAPT